ncbi:uncharacterized protein NPIL_189161 [Nephila pilipes]|uniref:Uncharacterized protein n=1 Tax=Nephila pilipes TaxID=299642 RepID=A0A8X6J082_NEPPI|nr:uncharacterized protein NPIL_189161 [Nephila pilipes]
MNFMNGVLKKLSEILQNQICFHADKRKILLTIYIARTQLFPPSLFNIGTNTTVENPSKYSLKPELLVATESGATAQAYISVLQCPMRTHDGDSEQIRFRVVRWLAGPSNRDLRKLKECVHLRIAYHQMLCSIMTLKRNVCDIRKCHVHFPEEHDILKKTASHQGGNE